MCLEAREYRATTLEHIRVSKVDKQRGGGPRVGPFQDTIPGAGWAALPKYDFTTSRRSCCFNERMHVEWENHADHILSNGGKLPTASVVAKAGFRSCAPCCRDMLALARPTGKTFIMVDLAEDDRRGSFHFVAGDKYLPVPKEACTPHEITGLKRIVADAQANLYASSEAIYNAVLDLNAPVDFVAQGLYLGDGALLPAGCAAELEGTPLLQVLHAEHFARLSAEYGASVLRDPEMPASAKDAVIACRTRAAEMLAEAWRPHLPAALDVRAYAAAAVAPLLPEDPATYRRLQSITRKGLRLRPGCSTTSARSASSTTAPTAPTAAVAPASKGRFALRKGGQSGGSDDAASVTSTTVPEDLTSAPSDDEDLEGF